MEKRSHRRIRDLDVLTAFQGLVANEIGCARISMMAREQETLPAMGRIQMRETNYLQIITSGLHRTAGPYRSTWSSDVDRRLRDGTWPSINASFHRKARLPFLKPDLAPNPIFAGHSYDCEGSELSVP
jgi:hypothetical protein